MADDYVDTHGRRWVYVQADPTESDFSLYGRCARKPSGAPSCGPSCCLAWRGHGHRTFEDVLAYFSSPVTGPPGRSG